MISEIKSERVGRPWYRSRWTAVVAAGGLTWVGLWVSGFEPGEWFKSAVKEVARVAKPLTAPTTVLGVAPPVPKGNDASVSKVPLDLILVATEPGPTPKEGLARLGVVRESPQTYVAGALLLNGARIAEIYADYIVLEKNGRSTRLYVDGSKVAKLGGASADLSPKVRAGMLTVGGTPPPVAAVATSHSTLTDYLRPSPMYEGSSMVGYQVYPGDKAGVFGQMGLKAGDVITAIDGTPLNEPGTAWETLNLLVEGVALSATVKRGGEVQHVTLDGALIASAQQQAASPVAPPPMP